MKQPWNHKLSRHERGYDRAWEIRREEVMRRDFGLCQCPECGGRRKIATHVHHIVSKAEAKRLGWPREKTDAMTNLIALNEACHDRMHNHTKRQVTGADGWPI